MRWFRNYSHYRITLHTQRISHHGRKLHTLEKGNVVKRFFWSIYRFHSEKELILFKIFYWRLSLGAIIISKKFCSFNLLKLKSIAVSKHLNCSLQMWIFYKQNYFKSLKTLNYKLLKCSAPPPPPKKYNLYIIINNSRQFYILQNCFRN